ncbi:MAG: hypothetical protein QG575_955 [Euryarchaeota archaeon]|nr:hypothetical protein [Euryarchaeota archaeon]
MGWPFQRRPRIERQVFLSHRLDRKALELQTAKEILEEVFGTTSADVEEMIRLRLAVQDALPENLKYL